MADEETNVAANETGEVATTPEETTETTQTETSNTDPVVATQGTEDVTQTQAFAQRLKEQTQKGIDKFYEDNYGVSNNVHSKADYDAAMQQQREAEEQTANQDRIDGLEKQGVDATQFDDYIANNPMVKKANSLIQKQELKDFREQDNQSFLDYFKKENKRDFDPEKDILPVEVWQENKDFQESLGKKGKSFIDAYQKHENSMLKSKLAEYEKGTSTSTANADNANSATGSVTGNGLNKSTALTEEMVNTLTPKQLSKRWKEVRELYKMK